jgi:cytochrome b6-f complex subunit 4
MFPVCIFGTFALLYWLSCLDPAAMGNNKPFATPLEILPEWYFYQFSKFYVTVLTNY